MTRPAANTWDGTLLLRRHLTSPQQLSVIKSAVSHTLQAGALAPSARQRLEQVSYLMRSA